MSRSTRRSPGRTSTPRARPASFGGARANYTVSWPEPADHALGHSRGGWTTKAHVAVDGLGRPLAIRLTPGQAGDNPELLPVLAEISVPTGHRPRSKPDAVVADKAYSHPSTRTALRRKGIRAVIPQRSDQIELRARRGSRAGRPLGLDTAAYRGRNVVERAFCRLKNWRGIATRYDKHARTYRAGLVLAAIVLFWL